MRERSVKQRRTNIPMALAGILFCLVIITTYFTSGLYARYTTTDTATDGARVAKFGQLTLNEEIDGKPVSGTAPAIIVAPGADISKKVFVNYTACEMDCYVFVAVDSDQWHRNTDNTFYAGLTKDKNDVSAHVMEWQVAEDWKRAEISEQDVYYILVKAGNALENKDFIKDAKISVSRWATAQDIAQVANYDLRFSAAVVQAGGFANAETAWNSVNN